MKRKRFHGSYEEDRVKRSWREERRQLTIREKGIRDGSRVRVVGREKIWIVEYIAADLLVKLAGANTRICPSELEIVSDE